MVLLASPVLVYNTGTSEITYNTSSIKYKKNVTDLKQDTSVLYNVRPVEYDSKDDDSHHIGFIAEELAAIDPKFVWNKDNKPEGIEWFNLLTYTINELKKLKSEVDILKSKIN